MVLGTKCNTLLLLDVVTSKVQEVLLPRVSAQRTPSGRAVQQSSSGAQVDGQVSPRGPAQSCGIHAVSLSPDGCILATGGANPNDCQVYSVVHTPGAEPGIKLAPCQTLAVGLEVAGAAAFAQSRAVLSRSEPGVLCRTTQTGCLASAGSPPATSSQVKAKH